MVECEGERTGQMFFFLLICFPFLYAKDEMRGVLPEFQELWSGRDAISQV